MSNPQRQYPLFSACGLNCGLCPRFHTDGASRCPGCGGEGFYTKRPSCGILSCNARHGGIEYCYLCDEYPCKKFDGAAEADSFITHQHMFMDFEKAKAIGLEAYQSELNEKIALLGDLLKNYDDGRHKSFFCLAVNLLELADVKDIMQQLNAGVNPGMGAKEKAAIAAELFRATADEQGISLKLIKKQK